MKNVLITTLILVVFSLAGCKSTTENLAEQQQIRKVQDEQFIIAQKAVDLFKSTLDKADKDNIAYFSPDNYKDALKAFKNANQDFTDIKLEIGASLDDSETYIENTNKVLTYLATAKGAIDGGYLIKDTAETNLKDSFEQKQRLLELSVNTLYSKSYKDINDELNDLVEYIADGKLAKAQDKQVILLKSMIALEVRAVKQIELSKLTSKFNIAAKARYNKIAPLSYQKATSAKANAEAVIGSNPRAKAEIRVAVDKALFEFDHLEHIALSIKKLKAISKNQHERFILNYENELNKVSTVVGLDNIRNLSLTEQIIEIVKASKNLNGEKTALEVQLAKAETTIDEKNTLLSLNSENSDSAKQQMLATIQNKEADISLIQSNLSLKEQKIQQLNMQLVELQKTQFEVEKQKLSIANLEMQLATSAQQLNSAKVEMAKLANAEQSLKAKELELMKQKLANAELKGKVESLNAQAASLNSQVEMKVASPAQPKATNTEPVAPSQS